MKKWICTMLAVLMLPVFATTAFAHGHGNHAQSAGQHCVSSNVCVTNGTCVNSCQYTDENGDDICDNCNNRCADCGEVKDENTDGICDNCGKCSHYKDENRDGICDHQADCESRAKAACKTVSHKSSHHGGKHRNHH